MAVYHVESLPKGYLFGRFLPLRCPLNAVQKSKDLMTRIAYQLRPPRMTTMAPCRICGRTSPGGQPCSECLCVELATLIKNRGAVVRWANSVKAAAEDEATVLLYAQKNSGNPTSA
jgi:hypothetical protein